VLEFQGDFVEVNVDIVAGAVAVERDIALGLVASSSEGDLASFGAGFVKSGCFKNGIVEVPLAPAVEDDVDEEEEPLGVVAVDLGVVAVDEDEVTVEDVDVIVGVPFAVVVLGFVFEREGLAAEGVFSEVLIPSRSSFNPAA